MNRRTFLASVLGVAAAPVAVTAALQTPGEIFCNFPPNYNFKAYRFGVDMAAPGTDHTVVAYVEARIQEATNQMHSMLWEEMRLNGQSFLPASQDAGEVRSSEVTSIAHGEHDPK